MDAQQNIPTQHRQWCQSLMSLLAEGGSWGLPRSGLAFVKRKRELVLVGRMPYHAALPMSEEKWTAYQSDDYQTIKRHFEDAGFKVRDETGKKS